MSHQCARPACRDCQWLAPSAEETLIDAARSDDQIRGSRLIRDGADVNAREEEGGTALSWADMRSNIAVAESLLKAGANPNLANELGDRSAVAGG